MLDIEPFNLVFPKSTSQEKNTFIKAERGKSVLRAYHVMSTLVGYMVSLSPPNSDVNVWTPKTTECDHVGKDGHCGCSLLRRSHTGTQQSLKQYGWCAGKRGSVDMGRMSREHEDSSDQAPESQSWSANHQQWGERHGAHTPSQPSGVRNPAGARLMSFWHPEPRDNPLLSSDCCSLSWRP